MKQLMIAVLMLAICSSVHAQKKSEHGTGGKNNLGTNTSSSKKLDDAWHADDEAFKPAPTPTPKQTPTPTPTPTPKPSGTLKN